MSLKHFVAAFAVGIVTLWQQAAAEVLVSRDVPVSVVKEVSVAALSASWIEIGKFGRDRDIAVSLQFAGGMGDLSAAIIDEANLNFFRQGLPYRSASVPRQTSPIQLSAKTWGFGRYFLLLDNRHAALAPRQARAEISYFEVMDKDAANALSESLGQAYAMLEQQFEFRDFNIRVEPCGQANAFSAPDITLCTELLFDLFAKDRKNAVLGIFFHELGHSLLNVWNMPGYDNEDIADEFAATLLLTGRNSQQGEEVLSEMIAWLSEHNSKAQAVDLLAQGSRHAPSIQRVRNLERIMANPEPLVARWNSLLYPRMKDAALAAIVESPGKHDDAALARQLLATRANTPASALPQASR
jgi:hypothetical protein